MDEEEILRSSLEQSNKIDIGNFFGSPIGGLANRAVLQSNTSLKASSSNLNLIRALQTSLESLRSEIQQITNYILVDKQERSKILQQRELEEFEREDSIQKGLVRPESAQPRGLEDSLPFFPEARFSEGLTAGMSSIGERQGVAQFQERFVEGSRPFFFGGLVPGSGDADTVNAKLTPGEFVVPKKTVENFSSNFFNNLTDSKPETNSYSSSIQYSTRGNPKTGEIEVDPNSLEYPFMLEGATQQFYQDKVGELESEIFDAKLEAKVGGYKPNISHLEEELNMYKGKYDDTLEYGTRYGVGGNKDNKEDDKEGGFFKNLFGGKNNENVKKSDYFVNPEDATNMLDVPTYVRNKDGKFVIKGSEDKRGLFGAIGGTIDAATGNLTDFDRRGGKPFGLMRGITGSIDAMTGGLTDLDRRGGKPFGTMRLATGVADAMTGNLFDFDRRGKGGKEKNISDVSGQLTRKDFKNDEDFEFYKNNFGDLEDTQLQNKVNQLPMETTVNPDGSITSKGSGTLVGGELVKPGESLTPMQRAAMTMGLQMGNTYSPEMMEKYKNSGGSPSKEEFDKSVRPEEEKSKNLKPEQTVGERFMNMLRGDKREQSSQLLSSAPSSNTSISSDDSIKTAAQGIMQPPQVDQSETIELPPQVQGDGGGGSGIQGGISPFKPSTPGYTGLSPTKSPMTFIDVISNQYLSVV